MARSHDKPVNQPQSAPQAELEAQFDQLEQQLAELEDHERGDEEEMSEIQDLVWTMIDDELTDDQLRRLEQLVRDDPEARETYVRCMQMHADLSIFFSEKRAQESGQPVARVLGLPFDLPCFDPDQTSGNSH